MLCEVLIKEGHSVEVLTSDYRHFEKIKRSDRKENFKFFNDEDFKNITYDLVYEELLDSANLFKPSEYSEELFGKLYEPQLF